MLIGESNLKASALYQCVDVYKYIYIYIYDLFSKEFIFVNLKQKRGASIYSAYMFIMYMSP